LGDSGTWASIAVAFGGRGNDVPLFGFSGTVDAGAGHDTVTLINSAVAAVFHGAGDIALVQDGDVTIIKRGRAEIAPSDARGRRAVSKRTIDSRALLATISNASFASVRVDKQQF